MTVTVDTLVTETMNVEVRLEGSVANGYQAGTPVADPETVELRGSAEQVARVKRVRSAILEADNLDQSFAGKLPLKLLDEDGEAITDSNVKLSEDSAYVTMTVGVVKRGEATVNLLSGGATAEQAKGARSRPAPSRWWAPRRNWRGWTEISPGQHRPVPGGGHRHHLQAPSFCPHPGKRRWRDRGPGDRVGGGAWQPRPLP